MAYSTVDLATIRAAIASGVRRVTFADGRQVEYQNLDHLVAAEVAVRTQLDTAARAAAGVTRVRFASFGSGL